MSADALPPYEPLPHDAMTAIQVPGDAVSDTKARQAYARKVERAAVAYYAEQIKAARLRAEREAQPVGEVIRSHYGARGPSVGFNTAIFYDAGKLKPGQKLYAAPQAAPAPTNSRCPRCFNPHHPDDDCADALEAAAQAAPAPAEAKPVAPKGFILVPEDLAEPTEEMLEAFQTAFVAQLRKRKHKPGLESAERAGLRAMLKAAT